MSAITLVPRGRVRIEQKSTVEAVGTRGCMDLRTGIVAQSEVAMRMVGAACVDEAAVNTVWHGPLLSRANGVR
jgi:hypothetical protein